ncbi:TonB-dependent receptor [Flavobacterium sp. MFBS3-15]|uniref:TonB-dependent receptor domain-containing protein n=1 Tax=Flavobacterium sp. MFBS3-15 TaxID=2989816 RepID=UPI0022365DE0|nr:TonB-dependent receptor [Flavobacterium sp. MFBS3-15]MCW4467599.1 TonB-dependent receptor [Flavobacterium sp. MFBS3-15]
MNHLNIKPGYCRLKKALRAFSLLLILFSGASVFSQSVFTGFVTDESNAPLANVEVIYTQNNVTVRTAADGTFNLLAADEKVHLVFYLDGYELTEQDLSQGQSATIILQRITELNEVVIEREQNRLFALTHLKDVEGVSVFAGKKTEVVRMDRITANKAANAARQIYSQVVGLTINENSDGGLQLNIGGRGLNPNRSSNFNTRQNGYDISADVLGYPESYYTPPAEGVSQIQVIRGAASLQYGTQFGGLVNFVMREPSLKPIEATVRNSAGSYGFLSNFTSVGGTTGKFSYYTFFNYKQGDGFRSNSQYNSRNFFVNVNYAFKPGTSLHFDYTLFDYLAKQPGGLTDYMFEKDMFQSNRTRNWFDVNWNLYSLRFKHALYEKTRFELQLFGLNATRSALGYLSNRVSSSDVEGTVRDLITGDFNNWGSEAKLLTEYNIIGRKSTFMVGAKYYQARNTGQQGPGSSGSGPDFNFADDEFPYYTSQSSYTYPNRNVSLFAENIFRVSDKFSITPGLRTEYIKTQAEGYWGRINTDQAGNVILDERENEDIDKGRTFLLAGLGFSYKSGTKTEWYANISQNYRSVTFNDIRTASPGLAIDPSITDEKGFTFDLGVRGTADDRFNYDSSVYLLYYNDKIGEYMAPNPNGSGAVVRYRSNIGTAVTYGWELLADWNIANTFFTGNRNFNWSVFVNNAITGSSYIKSDAPNIEGNSVEFVPLVNLKAGTSAGYRNFMASVQMSCLTEQFTDSGNTITDSNDNTYGIFGQIPSYYVADFSASYTWRNFRLEGSISNFTNNYYFTRRATGYPGPGILPSDPRMYYVTLQVKI